MADHESIAAELAKARAEYHEAAGSENAAQLAERTARIKAFMKAQSESIAAGAAPCPDCQTPPHGMLRTPGYNQRGRKVPPTYEVGCLGCGEVDGLRHAAQGSSPAEAVKAWNEHDWVSA